MSRPVPPRRLAYAWLLTAVLVGAGSIAGCSGGSAPTPAASAGPPGTLPLPGITDDQVRIGYTLVDGSAIASASEGAQADDIDPILQAQVARAYVDFVNRTGGAGGRELVAEVLNYPAVTASPEQALGVCAEFTQKYKVFAAVLDGHYEDAALACYRDARTLMLDESLVGHDAVEFEENSPFLWSPTHPEYGAFVTQQLDVLRGNGFFDGVDGVHVISADTATAERVTESIVRPFLDAEVDRALYSVVDISNAALLTASIEPALTEGGNGAYERVITIGGGGIVATALATAPADYYRSTWAVGSFDAPAALAANPARIVADRLVGSVGLGYAPVYDLAPNAAVFPDPEWPAEAVCKGILDAAGITLGEGGRSDYRSAFQLCDATLFVAAVLDRIPQGGEVTGDAFAAAATSLGSRYTSSLTLGGAVEPGQYAATNAGRVVSYDASCACFTYKGDDVRITAN